MTLSNSDLAELLSRASESETAHRQRALRRAAHAALWKWDVEAATLRERDEPLTNLPLVGPWIAHQMRGWFDADPGPPERPPIRAGFLTLAEVRATLADHREWLQWYRGDLQVHTTWSDGAESVAAMARGAVERGYDYVGITDHTKGLPIAGGNDEATVRKQWDDMRAAARALPPQFRILRAVEMNLWPDGSGDMSDDLLAELDLVVAAFHSKLRVKEDQTERFLLAVGNPNVHVLAHPRGRRYGVRLGLLADWDRVARAAAERDLALEIDSWPDRQDLDVDSLRAVAAAGTRVAIDTDAHALGELAFAEFGLAAAIRAGIRPERIVNFMNADAVVAWARESTQIARRSWSGARIGDTGDAAAAARRSAS